MKCIVHIGAPKTGSTLIQDWLFFNSKNLGRLGIYLPKTLTVGERDHRKLSLYFQEEFNNSTRRHGIHDDADKRAYFAGFRDVFRSDVASASGSYDVCIISCEHFFHNVRSSGSINEFKALLLQNFTDVKILCYFRNQYDAAISMYSTALKVDSQQSLDAFLGQVQPRDDLYNYLRVADRWVSAFGRDNCDYRIYRKSEFWDGDIRKDFLRGIVDPVNWECLDFTLNSANESLTYLQSVAYREVNRRVPWWLAEEGKINPLNMKLKNLILQESGLKKGVIESCSRSVIEGRFAELNDLFFERYFGSENQFLSHSEHVTESVMMPMHDVSLLVSGLLDKLLCLIDNPLLDQKS